MYGCGDLPPDATDPRAGAQAEGVPESRGCPGAVGLWFRRPGRGGQDRRSAKLFLAAPGTKRHPSASYMHPGFERRGEMNRLGSFLVVCGLVAAFGRAGSADVQEVYRSPFGEMQGGVAANPVDGSWWVGSGNSVLHLSADGAILSQTDGFAATGLSVDPSDGSCWVAHQAAGRVAHLAQDGSPIWIGDGFPWATSVSVDTSDGSCWVGFMGMVARLTKDGTELWRNDSGSYYVAADSARGTCWVVVPEAGSSAPVLLASDGHELARGSVTGIEALALDPVDGSLWTTSGSGLLDHYSVTGVQLAEILMINTCPASVAVNPVDETVWVADKSSGQLVQLTPDGVEMRRIGRLYCARGLAANPGDGSVLAENGYRIIRVSSSGEDLWAREGAAYYNLAVNSSDGSFWVTNSGEYSTNRGSSGGSVVKVSSQGLVLAEYTGISGPMAVATNPSDGSCWVADFISAISGSVLHVSSGGGLLWRGDDFHFPRSVSVNPVDGSCWVADTGEFDPRSQSYVDTSVAHLATDGSTLWQSADFGAPGSVAVNSADGTVWVLATDGTPPTASRHGSFIL